MLGLYSCQQVRKDLLISNLNGPENFSTRAISRECNSLDLCLFCDICEELPPAGRMNGQILSLSDPSDEDLKPFLAKQ